MNDMGTSVLSTLYSRIKSTKFDVSMAGTYMKQRLIPSLENGSQYHGVYVRASG